MIGLIILFIMLGIPTGVVMLIAEILIGYSRSKEARVKLENLIPRRDTSKDTSFPDLQNTVGGKRQDQQERRRHPGQPDGGQDGHRDVGDMLRQRVSEQAVHQDSQRVTEAEAGAADDHAQNQAGQAEQHAQQRLQAGLHAASSSAS